MAADDPYDDLFSGPVEDFVARRDALVKQLKADGDKEQAAVVKSWRRPSRVVGALNRLALTDEGTTAEFVEAARAVGSSRGPELREANEHFRAAVKQAAAAAVEGLDEARASDLGEITGALLTLGSDEDALSTFHEGRLLDLPDAGQGGFGFGLGLGMDVTSETPSKPRRATTTKQSAADREDELEERRRRAERRRLEAAIDEASAEVRKADEAAAEAQELADEARRQRDEAERALAAAEAAVEAAAVGAAEAQRALEAAEAALEE